MAIPGYQEFMYPFLEHLKDGKEHSLQSIYKAMAEHFQLTEEQIEKKLPSGRQTVLKNRVGWARTYLNKAGLLTVVRRGVFTIADEGRKVLDDPAIHYIDNKFLSRYASFNEFKNGGAKGIEKPTKLVEPKEEETPLELIQENYNILKQDMQDALLDKILECSPEFFEELIVKLVVAMGYGGSVSDAGQAIGKSGDGGIDGIIKEDILGLEMIYLQAKRWKKDSVVSRPDIQSFVGSLVGLQASKGIFITTTKFSKHARDYVNNIDKRVILLDGQQLTDLMFTYNVGVTDEEVFVTKRLDLDFFEE